MVNSAASPLTNRKPSKVEGIKENSNLDSLEESDEEEEFENIQIDKFVDLNKIIKMRCIFNYKFKKWVPVSVVV